MSLLAALLFLSTAAATKNELPPDVSKALGSAKTVELYSLEPWFDPSTEEPLWHDFVLLGHAPLTGEQAKQAVAQFEGAVRIWDGTTIDCFDARHALGVESDGHRYELVISFECHAMQVYRDDALVDTVHVGGTPTSLNQMLRQANLPLSESSSD